MRRAFASVVLVFVLTGCLFAQPAPHVSSAQWPQFRGDLSRDGHPPDATLSPGQARHYRQGWSHTLNGAVDGTPVVYGGMVFVASYGGRLDAYHLDDGAQVWSVDGLGAISGTPAAAGHTLVVATLTGQVLAFDVSRGSMLWHWSAPGRRPALWASPAIYRREVVIGVASQYGDSPLEAGRVVALDLATGKPNWMFCVRPNCAAGSGVWSSTAIDSAGHGFVGTGNPDDALISFDLGSGERLWGVGLQADRRRDLDVGATPVIFLIGTREVVGVGSDGGVFALFDAGKGTVIWSRQLVAGAAAHGLIASPAYDGQRLYVPSASAPTGIFALDPLTGATLWQRGIGLPVYSAPAVGNGLVVFGAGDQAGGKGGLYAVASADGSLLFGFPEDHPVLSAPSIAGSVVIVGDAGGNVMEFTP